MLKKKLLALFLLLAAPLSQSVHRHVSHEGGILAPHVDCTVCAWAQNASVTVLPLAGAVAPFSMTIFFAFPPLFFLFISNENRSARSRAPPSFLSF